MAATGSSKGKVRIAATRAENYSDSKTSLSVIIAVFGTHNPLVLGSNPGEPTKYYGSNLDPFDEQTPDTSWAGLSP